MKIFRMLIGISGSGKSTWVSKHSDNSIIICPDSIRAWLSDISDQTQNIISWKIASYCTHIFLEKGNNIVLDATNVNTLERRNFLERIPTTVKKHAIIFHITPDEAFDRIQTQLKTQKRSNVPLYRVYRMYGDFLYTLKVIKEENWDEITHIGERRNG